MPILEHSTNNSDIRRHFFPYAQQQLSSQQNSAIFLHGGQSTLRTPTADTDALFRQESNFYYLTGCLEPDCFALLHVATQKFALFVPRYGDEYALWCGEYPEVEDFKKKLGADLVLYNDSDALAQLLNDETNDVWSKIETIYTLEHSESVLKTQLSGVKRQVSLAPSRELYLALKDARLIKLDREIDELRVIGRVAARAHAAIMRNAKPGMRENELESFFLQVVAAHGCKSLAYNSIVAGDDRGATLHYVNNDQVCHDGGLVLVDAGGESRTMYASDITRTWPINGKFTEDQKVIYNLVLRAQLAVLDAMKPGVAWVDLHRLANKMMTEDLWKAGFLKADNLQELLDNHIGALFFPHGLGHSLGLDVHDPPNRDGSFEMIDEPAIRYLRVNTVLQKGMVMTVEPGCYFIPRFLTRAMNDEKQGKYLVREKIEQFLKFGGVRIEDDVLVTEDGIEILTPGVPKTVEEIEELMASGKN